MKKETKIYKKTFLTLLLIFPIIAVAEFYQFNMLWGNAFGITGRMLSWLRTSYIPDDPAYSFPLLFHRIFSFLPFDTIFEWAVFWAIIMNIVFFIFFIKRNKYYTKAEYLFIFSSMFILDVFVFGINKDIVQCIIIILIYMITLLKIKDIYKLLCICGILLLESLFFRSYYILAIATILIVFYALKRYKKSPKKNLVYMIITIFILLFLFIFLTQFINPDAYKQLLSRRDSLEDALEARTVIINLIPGSGYFNYCINYIINSIRMLFPVELLFMGVKYIPFFIYQLYLTIHIIKNIKNSDKNNLLNLSIVLGYWLMLFASESDFGTLVRHQAILLPFYLDIIKENSMKKRGAKKNEKN